MIATKIRRRAAVVATVLTVPALSSCAVSFDAQTDQYYTPTDGENAREGAVDILHALIVSESAGSGRLIAGLSNPGSDGDEPVGLEAGDAQESQTGGGEEMALTGVRGIGESEDVQFSLVEGETTIPSGEMLQLADEGSAVIAVSGDPEEVAPGRYVRLALSFDNGEEVELNVPVFPPGEDYADVEIPEAASGGATGDAGADEPAGTEG